MLFSIPDVQRNIFAADIEGQKLIRFLISENILQLMS